MLILIIILALLAIPIFSFAAGAVGIIIFLVCFLGAFALFYEHIVYSLTKNCSKHNEDLKHGKPQYIKAFREGNHDKTQRQKFPWSNVTNSKDLNQSERKFCEVCTQEEIDYLEKLKQKIRDNRDWYILNQSKQDDPYFSIHAIRLYKEEKFTLTCDYMYPLGYFLEVYKVESKEPLVILDFYLEHEVEAITRKVLEKTKHDTESKLKKVEEIYDKLAEGKGLELHMLDEL